MAIDVLMKQINDLPQSEYDKVVDYVQFILYSMGQKEKQKSERTTIRRLGQFQDEDFWIADDFDETPECFEEYM